MSIRTAAAAASRYMEPRPGEKVAALRILFPVAALHLVLSFCFGSATANRVLPLFIVAGAMTHIAANSNLIRSGRFSVLVAEGKAAVLSTSLGDRLFGTH